MRHVGSVSDISTFSATSPPPLSTNSELCSSNILTIGASSFDRAIHSLYPTVPAMADNQTPPETSSQGRGGRRRGRGGAAPSGRGDSQRDTDGDKRPKPRTRGGGRGGGDSGRQNGTAGQTNNKDTPPKAKVMSATKKPVEAATDDADDGEVCFICASPVEHTSVSPCNHRTCHICALRLRALYKNKACAHCRVRSSYNCSVTSRDTIGWNHNTDL
jgi:hypothetical protein